VSEPGPEPAPDEAGDLPQGWVRVGERRWWSSLAGVGTLTFVFLGVYGGAQLGRLFEDIVPWPTNLLFGVLTAGAVLVVSTLIRNVRYPQPWVNLDTNELRAGDSRTIALSDIDRALIPSDPAVRSEVLTLRLVAKQARVEIILRDRKGPRLDPGSTRALAEAVRRTSIAMPTSPDDPGGTFARYNFPGHIDLDAAVALVQQPPPPGKPLPAAW